MPQTLNGTPGPDPLTGTDPGNPLNPDGIDIINGLDGNDTLIGLGGNDTISGGLGADILDGGAGFDTLTFANATAGVWVNLNGAAFGGEAVGDTMIGFEAMIGSAFNDIFGGDGGNNTIDGGAGTDIISISGGTDFLDGGANGDFLDCRTSGSAVIINVATGIGGGGAAGITFANFENIIATGFDDNLTAAAAGSTLGGLGGNDTVNGADGNDVLLGDDFLNIIGTTGNDALSGGGGDDFLQGGALGDILDGGADSDTASYENSDAGVIVNLSTGITAGGHAAGDTLISVENVIGSQFDDLFVASAAANRFDGRAGGDGVTYAGSSASVLVNLNGGVGQGGWAEGDTFANNMEYVTGSNFDDTIYGNALDNILEGGEANDVLEGLVGADTLRGGNGSDTASYFYSATAVTVDLKAGFYAGGDAQGDVLQSIENVTGSGFADTLRGDDSANAIDGGNGNDQIASYAGADTINGGGGIDTVYYDVVGVTVNLATGQGSGGDAEGDTYQNIENVVGTAANDVLTGSAGANSLSGSDGTDTLTGNAGADILDGGAGFDIVFYDTSAGGVSANLTLGVGAFNDAQGDTYFGIENLYGSNFADTLIGNGGTNALVGSGGNDTLDGAGGADELQGGVGADSYLIDSLGDVVDEASGLPDEIDRVFSSVAVDLTNTSRFIGQVEAVQLLGLGNISITGTAARNYLIGNQGDNLVDGGAGADAMWGRGGNDTYVVDNVGDLVDENLGGSYGTDLVLSSVSFNLGNTDQALGLVENLTLTGSANINGIGSSRANEIIGNAGANIIGGGAGDDTLTGGGGNDVFLFDAALRPTSNVDTVTDMNGSGDDSIWLDNAVFTALAAGPLPLQPLAGAAFVISALGALDGDDRIIYNSGNGQLSYDADGNGSGAGILFAILDTGLSLTAADFRVV